MEYTIHCKNNKMLKLELIIFNIIIEIKFMIKVKDSIILVLSPIKLSGLVNYT